MSRTINNTEIRIAGLKRSGNHAIINWLASHYTGRVCFLNNVKPITNPLLTFAEVVVNFNKGFQKEININKEKRGRFSKKNCLIYSYEDCPLNNIFHKNFEKNHDKFVGKSKEIYNVLILRDPFNLFASRITHKNKIIKRGLKERRKMMLIKELKIKELWKSYAKEYLEETNYLDKNKILINYNLWFSNSDYRREIEKKLELKPNDKEINKILHFGDGSSFDGMKFDGKANNMKVLERWKALINNDLYRVILKDKELIELSNKIFGEIPGTNEVIINKKFQNIKYFYHKIKIRFMLFPEVIEEVIDYIDRTLGLLGIFLKKHHPKLYFKLKKIKR